MKAFVPNFIYGFEFEGGVLASDYRAFCNGLKHIHPDMTIDIDNSIKNLPEDFTVIEFSTKKLPEREAFILLEEILSYLWLVSQENIFVSNDTCGFHVNMSEVNIFNNRKQLKFYSNIVYNFEENEFLKLFGREHNNTCRPFKTTNKCKTVEKIYERIKRLDRIAPQVGYFDRVPRNKKYYAIALRENPQDENEKNHRIEFRFMGNKNYHLREKDLTKSIHYIRTITNKSLTCA